VRDRLARFAQATGRPFDFILRLYFHERFLARLAASPYRSLVRKAEDCFNG